MLSETIHSLVDTLNQGLLLIGETRSLMKPTEKHPYGFGMEANYWGLLAAMGILAFGGGLSIEHGIAALSDPHMPTHLEWALGVLVVALLVEGWVLWSVIQDLATSRGDRSWWKHLLSQPTATMTVLLEDFAAVLGCIVAGLAITACVVTGDPTYDAIGQIVVGGLLVTVGIVLLIRGRTMLIGESISSEDKRRLRVFLEDQEGIDRITDLKTRQLSPYSFSLKAEVVFSGGFLAGRLMEQFADVVSDCDDPRKSREFLGRYAEALLVEQARRVDEIEAEILEAFPGAMYIDLEPHLRESLN